MEDIIWPRFQAPLQPGNEVENHLLEPIAAESLVVESHTDKMPNKKKNNQARNPFYFFMVSLRPQLERQGVVLENGMQSLAEIAGPRWKVWL